MVDVLIIGYGYVGSAIGSIFRKNEKTIIDPKYTTLSISNVSKKKYDVVFVCVDTPMNENFKTLNTILSSINLHLSKGTIVCCKSTATPQFYKKAKKKYNNIRLVYSPEYLSHHSNITDFQNQEFLIFGGDLGASKKIASILTAKLKKISNVEYTDLETAALIKYSENAFLAYKITFFNELYRIHKNLKLKSSFEEMVRLLTLDKRIGSSHTKVPGRDGKKGWGGHCFTKDNQQFQRFTNSKLIEFMIKINKLHRSYDCK